MSAGRRHDDDGPRPPAASSVTRISRPAARASRQDEPRTPTTDHTRPLGASEPSRRDERAGDPPAVAHEPTILSRFLAARSDVAAVHPPLDPACPRADAPGDDRFALGGLLGEGGMGAVKLGVDRDLRRAVAIKALRPEHRDDPVLVRAFIEEAIITGGLEHPNIVPIHEVGYSPLLGPYYAMKRLEGEPLSELLSRLRSGEERGTSPARLGRYLEFFAQTLRAIAYAHDRGVVHCDLKPANLIVGRYGDVTVVDWGLAKVMGEAGRGQARAKLWSGSPGYMAPEQALEQEAEALDPRTDVWSLGAILYEILTLTLPFADADGALPEGLHWRDIVPPSERDPERFVPPELEALCLSMLARDPEARPATAQAVLADVEAWLDGSRERRRRQAAATHALDEALEALGVARSLEIRLDRAAVGEPGDGRPTRATPALERDRAALLTAYEGARDGLLAGLALNPAGASLARAAAGLYWYTVERIYPGRLATPPPPSERRRAVALLEGLARVALDAVIARGEAKGVAPSPLLAQHLARAGDRWLSAFGRFGSRWGGDGAFGDVLERVLALRAASLFAGTDGHELLAVAEACEELTLAPGARLFDVGDPGDALYIILDGEIDITRDGRLLTTLAAPACLGEVAVIDDAPRSASATARSRASLLTLTAPRFRQLIVADGAIGLQVMRVIARRLREATDRELAATGAERGPGRR